MLKVSVLLLTWDGCRMPSEQEMNSVMTTYGLNLGGPSFSFGNIMAGIIFGIIGMAALKYGHQEKNYRPVVIGLFLIIFPYFVSNTILMYVLGVGVSSLLYFWRD